jgi:hypothetical protein
MRHLVSPFHPWNGDHCRVPVLCKAADTKLGAAARKAVSHCILMRQGNMVIYVIVCVCYVESGMMQVAMKGM